MPVINYDGFYHASVAREIAVGNQAAQAIVLPEINTIQIAVDTAAAASLLNTEVVNATVITMYDNYAGANTSSHFDAWNDPITFNDPVHNIARAQMEKVIQYFTRFGYRIKRERDGTNNRLKWTIRW